jgi:hypothetical protein
MELRMTKASFVVLLLCAFLSTSVFARPYEFAELYRDLGYTDAYFGATDDEIGNLNSYTDQEDSFYSEINGFLRFYPNPYDWNGIGPEDAKGIVADIDRLLEKVPALPSDLILYRGMTLGWHRNKPLAIGEEFEDKAYVSTSTSRAAAEHFAEGDDPGAVLTLYFGAEVGKGLLFKGSEDEVMLAHGQKFRVMARRPHGRTTAYLVQICGQGPCKKSVDRKDVLSDWGK